MSEPIQDTSGTPGKRVPRAKAMPKVRRQTSFAAEDTSVLQWWDAQRDVALSLHDIIVEAIERNGYGDYHFRGVEQRPRVGRPPKRLDDEQGEQDAQGVSEGEETASESATARADAPFRDESPIAPASAPAPADSGQGSDDDDDEDEQQGNDPGSMDDLIGSL